MTKPVFIIEGVPGSGKSTFLKSISLENIKKTFENVPMEHLKHYINNIHDRNETWIFQKRMFTSKLYSILDSIFDSKSINIIDRGLNGDNCFVKKHIKNKTLMLNKWIDYIKNFKYELDIIKNYKIITIYLRCDPKVCMKRCVERDRLNESKYDLNYFQDLFNFHESEFMNKDDVIVVDWNENRTFEEIEKIANKLILKSLFKSNKVIFEGNIGVGKTTTINELSKLFKKYDIKHHIIKESNEGLEEYIKNQNNQNIVKKFEFNNLKERIKMINNIDDKDDCIYIFDRSVISSIVFIKYQIKNRLIHLKDFNDLMKRFNISLIMKRCMVFYLDDNYLKCKERCNKRKDIDYNAYNDMYFKFIDGIYKSEITRFNVIKVKVNKEPTTENILNILF